MSVTHPETKIQNKKQLAIASSRVSLISLIRIYSYSFILCFYENVSGTLYRFLLFSLTFNLFTTCKQTFNYFRINTSFNAYNAY